MSTELKATHTRGPWFVSRTGRYIRYGLGEIGPQYNICDMEVFGGPEDERKANASLLAAAPEQHAILKVVLAGFTPDPGTSDLDDEQPINVSMTLGDYRRIQRIVWKGEGR